MHFKPDNITIYSVGLLGGSLGLALKKSGFDGQITGLSSNKNLDIALQLGCIDKGYSYNELQKVIHKTQLLILCSPIMQIIKTIETLGKMNLPDGLLISDVGSTKKKIVSTALYLPDNVRFIGGHPMAGSERSGCAASDPYLFQNAIYVLTPSSDKPDEMDTSFAEFLGKYLGCRTLFLKPDVHDKIAATVSHIPHLLAVALVNFAKNMELQYPGTQSLAAGGFRDMTRIASAPYKMWHDILNTNKGPVVHLLDSLIESLEEIKKGVTSDSLQNLFDSSKEFRSQIPLQNKGFMNKLSEVLVLAKDQPGIILKLAESLSENGINIKDIEVLKVREGEGGTIRLAFESPHIAKKAVSILTKSGFSARERN